MTPGIPLDTELDDRNVDKWKTAAIDTELQSRSAHIAALQETRLSGAGSIKESNCTFYWFGKPEDQARLYGTGFTVHDSMVASIQTPTGVNETILSWKLCTE